MIELPNSPTPEPVIQAYMEGTLSEPECRELLDWLKANPAGIEQLLGALRTDGLIRSVVQEGESAIPLVASAEKIHKAAPSSEPVQLLASVDWKARWKAFAALAASIALLLGLAVWYFGPTMGEPVLAEVRGGQITVERGTERIPATRGTELRPNDVLLLGTNATALIAFGRERTRIECEGGTELRFVSLASGKQFHLRAGTLTAQVARQRPFQPLVMTTPNAEARVVGTRFKLVAKPSLTRLEVEEGKVQLADSANTRAKPVRVKAGSYAEVAPGRISTALPKTRGLLREYWMNYAGQFELAIVANPARLARPDGIDHLDRFESRPLRAGLRFCERLRGFLHPPTTGLYRLAVTQVHTEAALLLSRTDRPEDVQQVAWRYPEGGTTLDDVTPVLLEAGKAYYIEIIHESSGGDDHLTVQWRAPGREPEIIPGEFLSPFLNPNEKGSR